MKRFRQIIAGSLLALSLSFGALPLATAYADTPKNQVCNAIDAGANCTGNGHGSLDISAIVRTIIGILSILIGMVAVVVILIAGFKYVTAAGDSNKVSSAKNTLVYALVGLIIAALAQFLVQFVLANTTSASCARGQVFNSRTNKCQ